MIASIFIVACLFSIVLSFSFTGGRESFVRKMPLSTAPINNVMSSGGMIPRLEPGLRWVGHRGEKRPKPRSFAKATYSDLEVLSRPAVQSTVVMGGATAGIVRLLQRVLTRRTKTLTLCAILLLSCTGFVGKPLFASAASVAAPSVRKVEGAKPLLSRLFDFELNLLKFKKYSQLTPIERLATTPVFYLSNSRGNAYLQPDKQVGQQLFVCSMGKHLTVLAANHRQEGPNRRLLPITCPRKTRQTT
jgi:hypothetical protein